MKMHITAQEQELLTEILRQQQRQLLLEISHAVHHEFKQSLRQRVDVLEALLKKLDALDPATERAA